ncbi:MAG: LytTR family DNA-binding domain-containing protein [Microscillaceae bacterium]|jgi:DNA-binding LytR/AlgR family response regulator|nr:LytTR family DNA-binding domain-containing protein [Microscillaceae bacterium]
MTSILIIEDEKVASDTLALLLLKIDRNLQIKAQIDSVEDAVAWLKSDSADLIFVDIHLADGLGFQIFEQVKVQAPLVFTTAYNQYAIRAFKLNSIDYLLKPIDEQELRNALDKFKKLQSSNAPIDYQNLLKLIQNPAETYQKRFMVTAGEKVKSIAVEEVAYFYAEGRYIFLTTHDNRKYIIDYTLDNLAEVMNPEHFFRINRQMMVSFKSIKEMFSYPKGRVKIVLQPHYAEEVIVSLSKAVEFKQWLNR